jgi:hypothetical protein
LKNGTGSEQSATPTFPTTKTGATVWLTFSQGNERRSTTFIDGVFVLRRQVVVGLTSWNAKMNNQNVDGIVYALTNSAMPGLTKIGMTAKDEVSSRLNQLYSTGVPVPFDCAYACQVNDCAKVEEALHLAFGNTRVNPKREFFRIEAERVIAILKLLSVQDVTPQIEKEISDALDSTDKEAREDLKRSRRPPMNFKEMGIPTGSVLQYREGNAEVIVADERHVSYKGEVCSLTAATRDIMSLDYSVQPAPYWTYNGRTLKEIYEETYSDIEE